MKTRLACALLFALGLTSLPAHLFAADNLKVALVRQDFSDCVNSDVSGANPSTVAGFVNVHTEPDGSLIVLTHLRSGTPDTTYTLFVKCVGYLGNLVTDSLGVGSALSTIAPGAVGPVFAIDMYPDGAPLGNKFQSVQVNLSPPPCCAP